MKMSEYMSWQAWTIIAIVIVAICIGLFVMIDSAFSLEDKKQACKDKDMVYKDGGWATFDYCIEPDGIVHYVTFDCTGYLWAKQCEVQILKMGDWE